MIKIKLDEKPTTAEKLITELNKKLRLRLTKDACKKASLESLGYHTVKYDPTTKVLYLYK